ncbi:MAG: hypothetical protein V7K43_05780 [Nostoc sp.]
MSTANLPLLESKLCGASRKPCGVTLRAHPLVEKRSQRATPTQRRSKSEQLLAWRGECVPLLCAFFHRERKQKWRHNSL